MSIKNGMMKKAMVSPPYASKKPCTTPKNYCSASRLWKGLQTIIQQDQRDEFKRLLTTASDKSSMIIQVLQNSRLSTPSIDWIDPKIKDKYRLSKVTELNALQIALLTKHDYIAYHLVICLKRFLTPVDLSNYISNGTKLCALELASFWGMSKLVQLFQNCKEAGDDNNRLRPIDCATDTINILKQQQRIAIVTNNQHDNSYDSLLLKKATDSVLLSHAIVNKTSIQPVMSPLSFSSSSSSSSSFSSLSSFNDYQWTPPTSPLPILTTSHKEQDDIESNKQQVEEEEEKVVMVTPKKKVQFNDDVVLQEACIRGDLIEMKSFGKQDLSHIRDLQNRSLLHIALMHGQEHLVDYLYDKLDINHADNDGWTCLHYAAALGLWGSLQSLTSLKHCNVNARTNHGLKVEDCPESDFGKRKCRAMIDKVLLYRQQQMKRPLIHPAFLQRKSI